MSLNRWLPAVLVVVVSLGATFGFVALVGQALQPLPDEVKLPLLIIAAVVGLLGSLALIVIVFAIYELANNTYALALPDGSIRAVIALLLIVLFAVMTVFLTARLGAANAQAPVVDFAKQLLTILGTLMTSVASFYFGSRAVADGAKAAAPRSAPPSDLTTPTDKGKAPTTDGGSSQATSETGSNQTPQAPGARFENDRPPEVHTEAFSTDERIYQKPTSGIPILQVRHADLPTPREDEAPSGGAPAGAG